MVSVVNILVWLSAPTLIALKLFVKLDLAVIISTNSSPFVLAPYFSQNACEQSEVSLFLLNWSRSFWEVSSKFRSGLLIFLFVKVSILIELKSYIIVLLLLHWGNFDLKALVFVEYLMK